MEEKPERASESILTARMVCLYGKFVCGNLGWASDRNHFLNLILQVILWGYFYEEAARGPSFNFGPLYPTHATVFPKLKTILKGGNKDKGKIPE